MQIFALWLSAPSSYFLAGLLTGNCYHPTSACSVLHAWALQGRQYQAVGITLLCSLGTQLFDVLERRWDHLYCLSWWRKENYQMAKLHKPWSAIIWFCHACCALTLPRRCWLISPVGSGCFSASLEATVASTVGESFKLENYHLVFLTNIEHLKRIHIATVQEPQTIPRSVCLGSFPTPRQRLPNSILSYTRIKPERPMCLTRLFLICTSTPESKFGLQVSNITGWQH